MTLPAAPTVSAVIVHYRTPRRLEAAVAALRRDAETSGIQLEILVVDNSAADTERVDGAANTASSRLEAQRLGAQVIEPGSNLGYAGGMNLGVRHASGDALFLMNADVEVEPGCLAALLEALVDADIAGPRLFWDRECRLILPPQQVRCRRAELDALFAERWPAWARSYRRRWRRRARKVWSATGPMPSVELTGALLAVGRDCWRQVGPFDAGYRLYFEETDWLLRAHSLGARAVLAPAARAVHAFDQSAQREPRAEAWFRQSMERFRRRRYGRWFAALLRLLERIPRRFSAPGPLRRAPAGVRGETWVEATFLPLGVPAAGQRLTGDDPTLFEMPPSVAEEARAALWIWASDGTCRDLGARRSPHERTEPALTDEDPPSRRTRTGESAT